jgi:hypothetical protein
MKQRIAIKKGKSCEFCKKKFGSFKEKIGHLEKEHNTIACCLNCCKVLKTAYVISASFNKPPLENMNIGEKYLKQYFCCAECRHEYITGMIPKTGGFYDSALFLPGYEDQFDCNR